MALNAHLFLGDVLPAGVQQHLSWYLGGAILAIALAVGLSDLLRLSAKRIWAISGVCFDESIRRRILWITPLAILGIIIVSQLQRPFDEQDAIRQTIKICLFATGLLVVTSAIILACTNLPREIENRVIYTVVTKPTTRLEIVLGKVLGFARVSLAMLLIMGAFSYGYLLFCSWDMQRYIAQRISAPGLPASQKQTLEHYQKNGLLNARTLADPTDIEVFGAVPQPGATQWVLAGDGVGSFQVPFDLSKQDVTPGTAPDAIPGSEGLMVQVKVGYHPTAGTANEDSATAAPTTESGSVPYYGPYVIPPEKRKAMMASVEPQSNPSLGVEVLDENMHSIGGATNPISNRGLEVPAKNVLTTVTAFIPPNVAGAMAGRRTYIRVTGMSPKAAYFTVKDPVTLQVRGAGESLRRLEPTNTTPTFQSRAGSFGQQLRGLAHSNGAVAIYAYRGAGYLGSEPRVTFEAKFGIERSGFDLDAAAYYEDEPTAMTVRVRNRNTNTISPAITIYPESNRPTFFQVPASEVAGGNFDVLLRCETPGHFIGLQDASLAMVTAREPFVANLVKSLLILWLMSILVTAVAIFSSTFLSWPIAVVLTLLILLGHWGVQELGDATAPGIGNQIVNDLGLTQSAPAKAVSATVERLSGMLNFLSTILPDINRFAALEDIERGVTISGERLAAAAAVAAGFAIPLIALAYVILKHKEVAP